MNIIDAHNEPMTPELYRETFTSAWKQADHPTEVRAENETFCNLMAATAAVRVADQPYYYGASFVLDPEMAPRELLFVVPQRPELNCKLVNVGV